MLKLLAVTFIILLPGTSLGQIWLSELTEDWNRMTMSNIEANYKNVPGKYEKEQYLYLMLNPPPWVTSQNINDSTQKKIRYAFLQHIDTLFTWIGQDWIVIEVINAGEVTRALGYLIHAQPGNKSKIIKNEFKYGKWWKLSENELDVETKSIIPSSQRLAYGKGRLQDDIVVSSFKSGKALRSEYYLRTTLPDTTVLFKIVNRN